VVLELRTLYSSFFLKKCITAAAMEDISSVAHLPNMKEEALVILVVG
jgi:hypothetical protein